MRIIILFLSLFLAGNGVAAERELLLDGKLEFGLFGGPSFRFANIAGSNKLLLGGHLAMMINRTIYVGGAGGGTAQDIGNGWSSTSYGGGFIGMFFQPERAIHAYADFGLWSGNISPDGTIPGSVSEDFLILEPGGGIALNLMQNTKAMIGLSYRLVSSIDNASLSKSEVGGLSSTATIVFGMF